MDYRKRVDMIVLGGGFTGCAAAIAAARQGLRVLLLEASGFLGGAASNNLVFPFMGYSTKLTKENGETCTHVLSRGIFSEITKALHERLDAGAKASAFCDEDLKRILDDMVVREGVEVLFHAVLCGAEKDGAHLRSVSVTTKMGVLVFEAEVFIDCTGDADLCAMAGVPTRLGRENDSLCQPMTLCFRVANVDKQAFNAGGQEMQKKYREWRESGRLQNPRENILVFDYPVEGVLHFNTTRIVRRNPVDPFDMTKAEMEARRQVEELMNFFRETKTAGMENAKLIYTAPSIGVRESRMLDGAYTLSADDLVACTKFDDAIAAGNYAIDIHNPEGSGTVIYSFKPGTWYTIPYRSLTPRAEDCDNLLVGGRCISVTHEAQAAVRIMPICCTTGEAAGIGAAVALRRKTTVQDADIKEIQKVLTESGAYLGY